MVKRTSLGYRDLLSVLSTSVELPSDEARDEQWAEFMALMELDDEIGGALSSHIGGPPIPLSTVSHWRATVESNAQWASTWPDRVRLLQLVLDAVG